MKIKTKSAKGENMEEINLPAQFGEELRPDLIRRAVLTIQSHRKQRFGSDPEAGQKHSSKLSRRRRIDKTSYGHGISRVPRKIMSHRGTRFNWVGDLAPNTVGGRRAHPPKAEKTWSLKLNNKERKKAIRSAMSATIVEEYVKKRGHVVKDYPLVITDDIENLAKTKDIVSMLINLGLEKELERISVRKIRAGKGKSRARKYKVKKGPLFVVSKKCALLKASRNIPGVDAALVNELNAELLAPGSDYGRLTIYSRAAIERLQKEHLFSDSPGQEEVKEIKKETKKEIKKPAKKKVVKET